MYYSTWKSLPLKADEGYNQGYYYGFNNRFIQGTMKATLKTCETILKTPVEKNVLSPESIQLVNFNEQKGITVVKWTDGTITKVKVQGRDKYNPEVGLAMCIAKGSMGNRGNHNDAFKKWLPKVDGTETVC